MSAWTVHGGRLAEAKAHFGQADAPWLDLSTGINPHAWPGASDLSIDWTSLPDGQALDALERIAAHHFGVDRGHICALPGAEMGLRLLREVLPGAAAHVVPSYSTHAEMFVGSRPIDVAALSHTSGGTIVLANPNNPDGRLLSPDQLVGALERLSGSSGWLVIDEAFADATPESSLACRIGDERPLVIFRSFGKFFGLPGVRLGFVLGPRPVIAKVRARLGSWPVSSAALVIGSAAYRDQSWIARMRTILPAEADALDEMLLRHGFKPAGACPLFRLIETQNAAALFERLARRAILTRPFDDYPRWLRIGLPGSDSALARLGEALSDG